MSLETRLGATFKDGRCQFLVWAPSANKVEVHIVTTVEQLLPMSRKALGYHYTVLERLEPGS